MDQFKEIPLLESLLNSQKDVFYELTVNCSMQLTILSTVQRSKQVWAP